MKPFHIYLYGPARDALTSSEQDGAAHFGKPTSATGPLQTSFELATQRLERTTGISVEPDGSFGFVADAGKERLFGMLYDAGERLQYVDLQGAVTFDHWRTVLLAISGSLESMAKLMVLQLPDRTLKTFQQFEAENWCVN